MKVDIFIRRARSNGLPHPAAFDVTLDGEVLCKSETPFFDAARVLLAMELAGPDDTLVMRYAVSGTVALKGKVGTAAGLSIKETGNKPHQRRYTPSPYVQVASRIAQTPDPVPAPPPGAERPHDEITSP